MSSVLEEIKVGGIKPPPEHFRLGAKVKYHHRACVARLPKPKYGVVGSEPINDPHWECISQEGGCPPSFGFDESFIGSVRKNTGINKTIMVWPAEGEAVVIGLIRRGIGLSVEGYTSGYEYPEYEPGYFEAKEWHWLYQAKDNIFSKLIMYIPMWAAYK
jgi:hypothetical protein